MIKEKYINRIKETSINVVQTNLESVRNKDITKTGVRIYKDGFIGVAGAIGSFDEKELEKQAEEALENKITYEFEVTRDKKESLDLYSEFINADNVIKEIDELLSDIRREQPQFSFFNKINLVEKEVSLANDIGTDLYYRDKYIEFMLGFKEKTSINIFDGFVGYTGREYDRKEIIKFINKVCDAYGNLVGLPEGNKLPIVFSTGEYLPFIKFMEDLSGLKVACKSSLFSDKIGEKFFNEDFTLYSSCDSKSSGRPFFDAEGVVNENYLYPLIKDGVVAAPYTDKRVASNFKLKLTGSSIADYDEIPTLGFTSFKVKESEKTAKELLNGQMGIFVMIASGGDFTPEGDFGAPVQLAFLFDGENFIGRLPEFKISSNIFDMFGKDYIGVSKDKVFSLGEDKYMVMKLNIS